MRLRRRGGWVRCFCPRKLIQRERAIQVLVEIMQKIYPVSLTPKEYSEQHFEEQVQKPENCTNCGAAHSLEALGYYWRWISYLVDAMRIRVRRFLCLECLVSISCLPDFAQPYRVVNTQTVEGGFQGKASAAEVHWGWLILSYWKKFTAHLQTLRRTVGNAFGRCPLRASSDDFWKLILNQCGSLAGATEQLISQFHSCLFGTYRCHQRKIFAK